MYSAAEILRLDSRGEIDKGALVYPVEEHKGGDIVPALRVGEPGTPNGWAAYVPLRDVSTTLCGNYAFLVNAEDRNNLRWLPASGESHAQHTVLVCNMRPEPEETLQYLVRDQDWKTYPVRNYALARGCWGKTSEEQPQYAWILLLPAGFSLLVLRQKGETVKEVVNQYCSNPVEKGEKPLNLSGFRA